MQRYSAVVAIFSAWVTLLSGQTQPPVFRADADTVSVNVSVKKNNLPVLGLTVADFRLYDNDVPQRVAAVAMDAVPVDVSIVVDLSPSIAFRDIEAPREAVRRMTAFLRPTDRFRVLAMGNSVMNAIPWQTAGPADTSRIHFAFGHISLVADSVLVALLQRSDPDRRHLVVALTDGKDICSLATGETLRSGAERSGAVFHWINLAIVDPSVNIYERSEGVESTCRNRTSTPIDIGRFLSDATRLTGGSKHTASSSADTTAIAMFFDAILDDFRRSYILHYVPDGVSRTGFHRLRVELPGRKGDTVRTRPGYWGAAAAPPAR